MPRTVQSIDAIVVQAVSTSIQRIAPVIQRHIADIAAEQLERKLALSRRAPANGRPRRRARPEDLTRWVADKNARRVPKFVIEMTGGLDTKKKIVAKFGPDATFEKGKPVPRR